MRLISITLRHQKINLSQISQTLKDQTAYLVTQIMKMNSKLKTSTDPTSLSVLRNLVGLTEYLAITQMPTFQTQESSKALSSLREKTKESL